MSFEKCRHSENRQNLQNGHSAVLRSPFLLQQYSHCVFETFEALTHRYIAKDIDHDTFTEPGVLSHLWRNQPSYPLFQPSAPYTLSQVLESRSHDSIPRTKTLMK